LPYTAGPKLSLIIDGSTGAGMYQLDAEAVLLGKRKILRERVQVCSLKR